MRTERLRNLPPSHNSSVLELNLRWLPLRLCSFLFFGHTVRYAGSSFPNQGWNCSGRQSEPRDHQGNPWGHILVHFPESFPLAAHLTAVLLCLKDFPYSSLSLLPWTSDPPGFNLEKPQPFFNVKKLAAHTNLPSTFSGSGSPVPHLPVCICFSGGHRAAPTSQASLNESLDWMISLGLHHSIVSWVI